MSHAISCMGILWFSVSWAIARISSYCVVLPLATFSISDTRSVVFWSHGSTMFASASCTPWLSSASALLRPAMPMYFSPCLQTVIGCSSPIFFMLWWSSDRSSFVISLDTLSCVHSIFVRSIFCLVIFMWGIFVMWFHRSVR